MPTDRTLPDDGTKRVGTWKLKSFVTEFRETGEQRHVYGRHPRGYIVFTPEGRLLALITGENRRPAQTSEEQAALFTTMVAYSGIYRVDGDKFVAQVDASWNETWVGTEHVRFFKVVGDRLEIVTAWAPSGALPRKPTVRGIIECVRTRA